MTLMLIAFPFLIFLFTAIFCSRAGSLRSCRMRFWTRGRSLSLHVFESPPQGRIDSAVWLVVAMWSLPSRRVLCTVQWEPFTSLQCHFIQISHIRRVYVRIAVTCQLYFWQNYRDLLRATTVTRGWNEYRNESQHRKMTPKKTLLSSLLPGLEPATFEPRIRRSATDVIKEAIMCG